MPDMMAVTYDSNNSGGEWRLKDDDWGNLALHGWDVEWYADQLDFDGGPYPDGRWLGALATRASKAFPSMAEAIAEWESITRQNSADLGCGCCGAPHSFESETEYYSPKAPREGARYA